MQLAPEKFWPFSAALFEAQKEYFDVGVVKETRNETYGRLAKLAGKEGVDEGKILELLRVSEKAGEDGSLNVGNGVTNDVKFIVKVSCLACNAWSFWIAADGVRKGGPVDGGSCIAYGVIQCKWPTHQGSRV